MNLAVPVPRDLDRQPGRCAEAIQAEPSAGSDPAQAQGAITDDPAAQEGRGSHVSEPGRDAHGDVRSNAQVVGEATVAIPAGEGGRAAQVLAAGQAGPAGSVGPGQPCRPGPLADDPALDTRSDCRHDANRLVARDDRRPMRRKVAGCDLEIGPANRARGDAQDELARQRVMAPQDRAIRVARPEQAEVAEPRAHPSAASRSRSMADGAPQMKPSRRASLVSRSRWSGWAIPIRAAARSRRLRPNSSATPHSVTTVRTWARVVTTPAPATQGPR